MNQWTFILTYGFSLDVYTFGDKRIGIDRNTGRQVLGYIFKEV